MHHSYTNACCDNKLQLTGGKVQRSRDPSAASSRFWRYPEVWDRPIALPPIGEERRSTWDYQKRAPFAPEIRALYKQRRTEWMDHPEIVSLFRDKGVEGVNPLLCREEQDELFETVYHHRMAELILQGLNRF